MGSCCWQAYAIRVLQHARDDACVDSRSISRGNHEVFKEELTVTELSSVRRNLRPIAVR